MKKTISGALLALVCTGSFAQIFGPVATPGSPTPVAQPLTPGAPRATVGSRNGPPAATDFRSAAMACANTGKESVEAFDACMKSTPIYQPGVPKAILDSNLAPAKGPASAAPLTKPSNNDPANLFATPLRK